VSDPEEPHIDAYFDRHPVLFTLLGWAMMILFGPALFQDIVGSLGGTDWRQWAAAITGTLLWGAVILWAVSLVYDVQLIEIVVEEVLL
jgi:hypothetical protein